MLLKDLIRFLEAVAPPSYQESYDNAGLIVGQRDMEVSGVITCLDSTEAVIDEAIAKGCNLVVAHHPIVFKGLKRLNGSNYVERVVIKAIQHNIAIYAIHTNLDNVYNNGVNAKIAERLGLEGTRILAPKKEMLKLVTYVPQEHLPALRTAIVAAGAVPTHLQDRESFATSGQTTEGVEQYRLELLVPSALKGKVQSALTQNHPSSAPLVEWSGIHATDPMIGSGMIGHLAKAMDEVEFLGFLKAKMEVGCIKHTALFDKPIKKVAVCGGAGGFLLRAAIAKGADVFITSDYKYHEFFDADGRIIIADIGHYESEQYTIDLLYELISEKFINFAVHRTEVITNPVHYF